MATDLAAGKALDADRRRVVEELAQELVDTRNMLDEVSARFRKVERRVKSALPPSSKAALEEKPKIRTSGEARRLIDRLTQDAMFHKPIKHELRNLPVKDGLALIARELGLTNTALPPKAELIIRIATRINQKAIFRGGGFTAWLQRAGQQKR